MFWNWTSVYNETGADKAYDLFLDTFNDLYDKDCPRKRYSNKNRFAGNPWMTMGLQNACKKKKNILYRQFTKNKMRGRV